MEVRWHGQSCFTLKESTGTAVITDPYRSKHADYDMPSLSGHILTISHPSLKKNALQKISGKYELIDKPGSKKLLGVKVSGVNTDGNDNKLFKYRIDGLNICHMGLLKKPPKVDIIEAVGTVDILIIPVGGKGTIEAKTAKEYVDLLMPNVVIPITYESKKGYSGEDDIEAFLDLFDKENIKFLATDNMLIDRVTFSDDEETIVLVFEKSR